MAQQTTYYLKGEVVGGCNCDWGCPCNFEVAPSYGFCEGDYVWVLEQGHFGDVMLDGLSFGMFFHSPEAIHLGNLTTVTVIDERATPPQRQAIEEMVTQVVPFSVFTSLSSNILAVRYAPFQVRLDGINSHITISDIFELGLTPMTNPVTGEPELATLHKPTGFTSQVQELCTTTVERFNVEGLSYDHSGKYAEYAPFEYKSS